MNIDPDATLNAMRNAYGEFIERVGLLSLDPRNVPSNLIPYIPYAALWGIADDIDRETRVDEAPDDAKTDLVRIVQSINGQLDEWLAGSEAYSSAPSKEYIAFSAMRMAADIM